ncbi:MAG: ABC transporter permease, partial [Limnochordia bacterium]
MISTWKIAKWEVLRNLTNKQFIIGLLLTPLIMVAFIAFPMAIEHFNKPEQVVYQVVDEAKVLPMLEEAVPEHFALAAASNREEALAAVQDGAADGYLLLGSDFLFTGYAELHYDQVNQSVFEEMSAALTRILQQKRLEQSQLNPAQLQFLTAPAALVTIAVDEAETFDVNKFIVSAVSVLLIYILIFTSGSMLMMSALQERRDRMAEVILSSVRAADLMQGKIIGHFLLGVIQLAFWSTLALPAVIILTDFPLVEALAAANMPLIIFFGLLGYLLTAAMFVGLGATMDDMQSAGNSQGLVIMLPTLSFLFIAPVVQNPNGVVSRFASLFPFTSWVILTIRDALSPVP